MKKKFLEPEPVKKGPAPQHWLLGTVPVSCGLGLDCRQIFLINSVFKYIINAAVNRVQVDHYCNRHGMVAGSYGQRTNDFQQMYGFWSV